jgi:hypothetical protein
MLTAEQSAMCLLLQERVDALFCPFHGPPQYFGTNKKFNGKDPQELKRRSKAGYRSKCTMAQLEEVPFLHFKHHGPTSDGTAPSRDRRT